MTPANPILAALVLAIATLSSASYVPAQNPVACGSRGLPPCPSGQTCIDNPVTPNCGIKGDCPGICATLDGPSCGGFTGLACPDPAAQICVDVPVDGCDPDAGGADCPGVCVYLDGSSAAPPKYPACGGLGGVGCLGRGQICIDDPRRCPADEPNCCGLAADCPGICVIPDRVCGGLAGIQCPTPELICVDDPRDDCDPFAGGSDCGGICV